MRCSTSMDTWQTGAGRRLDTARPYPHRQKPSPPAVRVCFRHRLAGGATIRSTRTKIGAALTFVTQDEGCAHTYRRRADSVHRNATSVECCFTITPPPPPTLVGTRRGQSRVWPRLGATRAALPPPLCRGLHSSAFRLNVSAFCGIGGAFRGCLRGVRGVPGVLGGV